VREILGQDPVGRLVIPLLGLFDLVSGLDLSFSIFYLRPI
jgi:hypothetical protein